MLHSHNVLGGDITQKVLEAVNRCGNEKEVIVDDIDEIPYTGIIVPSAISNSIHNPLNNLQRRGLMARNTYQTNASQFKKIDMLAQMKNIDDMTGLNTIHEKRNSMESIETDNMNKRSPNMTNSGSSSQNISKTVSRTHSKHPSLDFRMGHSNSSSMDFRPMHSKRSSGEMWAMHSKQSSVDIKPTHTKQSSADFRTLNINKEPLNHGVRVEKEIDVVKYNLLSPKTVKPGETVQYGTNMDYFDKRNRFINELQKTSVDKAKRGNSGADHVAAKGSNAVKQEENKPKLKASNTLTLKDKAKIEASHGSHGTSKHKRTYSGNIGKGGELMSPREDLALSAIFLNAKNPREIPNYDNIHLHTANEPHFEHNVVNTAVAKETKKVVVDDSMKKLTNKTDLLEGQIKNIFTIIESFASEKAQLEEKIQTQDQKIKELMELTTKYQEEIKVLKGKNGTKGTHNNDRRSGSSTKGDKDGLNILTTTDGSAHESSLTESSGYLSNKEKITKSKTANFSTTPHGQTKMLFSKTDDKKLSGIILGNKQDPSTKKLSIGTKKPVIKKL